MLTINRIGGGKASPKEIIFKRHCGVTFALVVWPDGVAVRTPELAVVDHMTLLRSFTECPVAPPLKASEPFDTPKASTPLPKLNVPPMV
jgi:hypothetical protein